MDRAKSYLEYGYYWCEGGRFEGDYLNNEFWDHYEKATGEIVKEDDRGSFLVVHAERKYYVCLCRCNGYQKVV